MLDMCRNPNWPSGAYRSMRDRVDVRLDRGFIRARPDENSLHAIGLNRAKADFPIFCQKPVDIAAGRNLELALLAAGRLSRDGKVQAASAPGDVR
jgi:hypothetical protein